MCLGNSTEMNTVPREAEQKTVMQKGLLYILIYLYGGNPHLLQYSYLFSERRFLGIFWNVYGVFSTI